MAPPPPPPPPPPPICLPFFGSKKPARRLSLSSTATPFSAGDNEKLVRQGSHRSANSYSTSSSMNSMTNPSMSNFTALTFRTDSEKYDDIPTDALDKKGKLIRSNTMTGTPRKEKEKDKGMPTRWGYGFGLGKKKEAEADAAADTNLMRGMSQRTLPVYQATSQPPTRHNSQSTQASRSTQRTQDTQKTGRSHRSQESRSGAVPYRSQGKTGVTGYRASQETLVQSDSMYRRKLDDTGSIREVVPTSQRLEDLRKQMQRERIDIYIIPSEDAHGSEYVAASDQRRRFISGFSGSTGHAIVTDSSAYIVTDSRYWLQAIEQIDENWKLVRAGHPGEPGDWIDFLETICQGKRIGVDGRMLSYDKAMTINNKINQKDSKLVYPVQNLVDLIWKDKPSRSKDPVFTQPREFTGEDAQSKIAKVRAWLKSRPPDRPSYARSEPKPQHYQVGTLITALDHIAYLLNLRGSDIPYNPLFHAYLFIGLDSTILFLEGSKVNEEVNTCLNAYGVERRDYNDIWKFLRKREWGGDGKIIIAPESSYTISLVLSNYRTTVLPSYIMNMMAVKNETEIEGLRRAYLRDGVAFVQFLAWLEDKINNKGYDITEWEASQRILEFRKKQPNFMGLAYATISATGAHAALPHYVPRKSEAAVINRTTPYLNDSGGQYRDGTCDTTRTVHLGRPTPEQCDAYTRVLQGHIAIDTAVFPDGTSGRQLDVLARNALWREGMNYGHGTGHGFGSFLTVHEGPHGFTSEAPLRAGYVITNEPGYYLDNKWGVRIESALVIRRARTKHDSNGDWLSFERLTCVPIQLKMVNKDLLTSAEKTWLIAHNKECFRKLKPLLYNDKRALDWLKREANRDIGIAAAGPGGLTIEWG